MSKVNQDEWKKKTIHRDTEGVWIITDYLDGNQIKEKFSRHVTLLKLGDIRADLILWEAYLKEMDLFEAERKQP